MKNTAEHFGFKFSKPVIKPQKDGMLRVLLDRNGTITTEYKDLKPPVTTKISISPVIVNSSNEFLYYKTTYRPYYFDSYKKFQKVKSSTKFSLTKTKNSQKVQEAALYCKLTENYIHRPLNADY